MTRPSVPLNASAVEQLIHQVRGIQAVRVITDAHGSIDKIHAVGLPGRSAKQIVRDIESILYVQGKIRLDHRKISLVQVSDGIAQRQETRLMLLDVVCEPDDPGAPVTVTLGLNERQARGVSPSNTGDEDDPLRPAAWATIDAITQFVGKEVELRIEQIAENVLGDLRICVSHVDLAWARGNETLLGISMVGTDRATAAARSVLDALNRPLTRLLAAQS